MSNLITWSKILDFSGKDLDTAQAKITQFENVLVHMVTTSVEAMKKLNTEMVEIKTTATNELKAIEKLSTGFAGYEQQLMETSKKSQDLISKDQNLKKVIDDQAKSIKLLEAELKKITKAKEDVKKATDAEVGSLTDLRKKLIEADNAYKALGDSVDDSIKEQHLQRVRALATEFNDANKALTAAKKSITVVANSYNELSARVAEARNQLKGMENGMDKNSQQAKNLKKFIKEGDDQLKEFDKSIGQNQRSVGDYEIAIDALDNRMGGLIGNVKMLGQQLLALAMNPVVATIAVLVGLLAAAAGAMKAFFDTTMEGQEELDKQTASWDAFFFTMKSGAADAGEELYKWFGGDGKLKKLISETLYSMAPSVGAQFYKTATEFEKYVMMINQLWKDHLKDIVDDANTELKVNEKLEESKDKLAHSDEERLAALREANKFLKAQMEGDLELAKADVKAQEQRIKSLNGVLIPGKLLSQYTDQEIQAIHVKKEEIQKLAELQIAQLKVESDASLKRKALLKQEIALVEEIEKTKRETAYRAIDTQRSVDKLVLESEIKNSDAIIANEEKTQEEKDEAIREGYKNRINLLNVLAAEEQDAALRAAEDRIRSEGKVVTQELLANDAGYQNTLKGVTKKYFDLATEANDKTVLALQKNAFTKLNDDVKVLMANIARMKAEDLDALNKKFTGGDPGNGKNFEKERLDIQEKYQKMSLDSMLKYLKEKRDILAAQGKSTVELDKAIAEAEVAITNESANKRLEAERELHAAVENLKQVAFSSASQIIANITEAENMKLDEDLKRLEKKYTAEITAAGDDKKRKEKLEYEYNQKVEAIERQKRANQRRQAKYDKAIALTQAGVNIAQGVTAALSQIPPYSFVLAALVAAAGALQIAAIASKPLPAYAVGVDSSPEGWAVINEEGSELLIPRSGKPYMVNSDGPTATYLQQGTRVLTAEETQRALQGEDFNELGKMFDKDYNRVGSYLEDRHDRVLTGAINANFSKLHNDNAKLLKAMSKQKFPDYMKQGTFVNEVWTDDQNNKEILRSKSMF